jgi:hypothetical protein
MGTRQIIPAIVVAALLFLAPLPAWAAEAGSGSGTTGASSGKVVAEASTAVPSAPAGNAAGGPSTGVPAGAAVITGQGSATAIMVGGVVAAVAAISASKKTSTTVKH